MLYCMVLLLLEQRLRFVAKAPKKLPQYSGFGVQKRKEAKECKTDMLSWVNTVTRS